MICGVNTEASLGREGGYGMSVGGSRLDDVVCLWLVLAACRKVVSRRSLCSDHCEMGGSFGYLETEHGLETVRCIAFDHNGRTQQSISGTTLHSVRQREDREVLLEMLFPALFARKFWMSRDCKHGREMSV